MWALILGKWLELSRMRKREQPLDRCLKEWAGDRDELSLASWQKEILSRMVEYRRSGIAPDKRLLAGVQRSLGRRMERFVPTILVLAAAAPLLGLLGTVEGMIETFRVISASGTSEATSLSSGISQALITTQTGLVVAVPGLVLGNFLRRRARGAKGRMERFCLGLLREGNAPHPDQENAEVSS
jgi:biopolymer transport protein ExbB